MDCTLLRWAGGLYISMYAGLAGNSASVEGQASIERHTCSFVLALVAAQTSRDRVQPISKIAATITPLPAMATSPEALAERRRKVEAELLEVRRATKKEKDKVSAARRAAGRSSARAWVLVGEVKNAALITYALTQFENEPVVKYLGSVGRQCHWPAKTEAELVRIADDCFASAVGDDVGLDMLAQLTDTDAPSDAGAMRTALAYVEEWRVVEWARAQAVQKGVAVSTDLLLHQAESRRAQLPEATRLPPRGSSADSRGRQWAYRLRQRWGGRHGKFKVREVVPLPEMREKALRL